MQLFQANHQWATRPEDERPETPEAMRDMCRAYAEGSATATVPFNSIRVEAFGDDDLSLIGSTGQRALFTHYAFGQLCARVQAPADFMRGLPPTLAMQIINHQLKVAGNRGGKYDTRILFHRNGGLIARAITSELYDRVWNYELIDRGIIPMVREYGWKVPSARPVKAGQRGTRKATQADVINPDFPGAIRVGDDIAPSGLYCSDHDMFAFLVHSDRVIRAGKRTLMRGIFVRNSEVGDGSLEADCFSLDGVCGNHICHGVEGFHSIRIRHIVGKGEINTGKTFSKFLRKWEAEIVKYAELGTAEEQRRIDQAMKLEITGTKEEVIDKFFAYARSHSLQSLGRKRLEAAYELAERSGDYGSPRSPWAIVGGLTELSQGTYADERQAIDGQAGRLLEMAF